MPVLDNPQYENFALGIAEGLSPAAAYVRAGFSAAGSRQGANRLLHNLDVSARILELRTQIGNALVAGIVARELCHRQVRIDEIQARWNWLRDCLETIIAERGAQLADECAGGATGIMVKDFKAVPAMGGGLRCFAQGTSGPGLYGYGRTAARLYAHTPQAPMG